MGDFDLNPTQHLDVNDLHREYGQQLSMLSQRCALLAAANGAQERHIKELTNEIADLKSGRPVVD